MQKFQKTQKLENIAIVALFKIANASFNLFRVGFYHLQACEGQAQEGTNPYLAKRDTETYVDFLIWTWQKKKRPYYIERSYI